ncbi:ABC transporter permease [Enterococcus dongliensis]|uniref:ABC transporter permease n=1 Tax=Enterococcus dongliensis TaxID=2559925 RepID=UPI00288DA77B|nr:ABC transporter permease [Enterococcus dongliensis]MDT2673174.1 ABC transporter permease [Enterococcus dongliensis]
MLDFFLLRRQRHQKKMMKYMRYVLNDHFVLVCLFLAGGLAFYYSNLLNQLSPDFPWSLPIVGIIWWVILPLGKLATLVEPADMAFLLPKEKEMGGYLSRGLRHSLAWPFSIELFVCGALLPLIVLAKQISFMNFFFFVVMLWSLKLANLRIQRFACYQTTQKQTQRLMILWFIISGGIIFSSLYSFAWLGTILAFVTAFGFVFLTQEQERLLDWSKMIDQENTRLHRIYQFINLFTDVPEIEAKVHRRKYLDGLLAKISFRQENTFLYLFARGALRGAVFGGLFFRLLIVGAILVLSLTDSRFIAGVSALFIYLIGFQMIPLYSQFDYIGAAQLYPVLKKHKKAALQRLMTLLLFSAALIFSLCSLLHLSIFESLGLFGLLLVEIGLFAWFYLPARIKKMED